MERRSRLWSMVGLALLACTALIPLTAPVFPTQDGPVHLYYVDVLRALLKHSAPYAQHFEIKGFLTPYALEYYSLLALETVFSAVWSEKLLVAGYIFAFGLGYRYLVESVAERGSPWILTGIPFCLNMLVYMGFMNYSFAVALLLFQCGFWIRVAGSLTRGRVAALLAGMVLMLLTHPVPVAIFLLFIGIYFASDVRQDVWAGKRSWKESVRVRRGTLVLMVAMGAMALLWVSRFMDHADRGSVDPYHAAVWGWFNAVATELQLYPVAAFTRLRYRAGPILLMAFACAALVTGLWKNRRTLRPVTIAMMATSGVCFLLFCIVPDRMNGSYFFAERFPILWLLFLLAGTASLPLPGPWSSVAGGMAAAVTAGVLLMQWVNVAEISERIALTRQAPPSAAGSLGLIVGPRGNVPEGLMFNPYMWGGVTYFRRSRAILTNDPWMDVPIIMLRPSHPFRWSYLDPDDAGNALIASDASRTAIRDLDFVVSVGPWNIAIDGMMARAGWSDSGRTSDFIRIYRRP